MKFKKSKNRKNKLHIKFDQDDRKEYLLGFRKRKLERKEKAKLQMEDRMKKQKKEIKQKRIDFIKKMIEDRTTHFSDDDSEEEVEDEAEAEAPDYENISTLTDYDNCTVEVSDLNLQSKAFLGIKKGKKSTAPSVSKASSQEQESSSKFSFKLPVMNKISNKKIKTSIWKTASRKAKKAFDQEKRNKRKKKKVQITEL